MGTEQIRAGGFSISTHALTRFRQRRALLGHQDDTDTVRYLPAIMAEMLHRAERISVDILRNGTVLHRRYPNSSYLRYEQFIFVVDWSNQTVVTCFPFIGLSARRAKPKQRDKRAREKQKLRRHLQEGREM